MKEAKTAPPTPSTISEINQRWLVLTLMIPKIMIILDICSDVNIGVKLSYDTYLYRGRTMLRHGWWLSIVVFSVLVPFVCRWASEVHISNTSRPLELAATKGQRASAYAEWLAYVHVVPCLGILLVLTSEAYGIVTGMITNPIKLMSGTFVPLDERERTNFLSEIEEERINDLSKSLFFHIVFEDILQLVLQLHMISNLEILLDGSLVTELDVLLSLFATILNIAVTAYKVNAVYRDSWDMCFGSTWLVCLLGHKLHVLRDLGYFTPDWGVQKLPERFTTFTPTNEGLNDIVSMFQHVCAAIAAKNHESIEHTRIKLGTWLVHMFLETFKVSDDQCLVSFDTDEFDSIVNVKPRMAGRKAAALYDLLACRGSHGHVKLTVCQRKVTPREIRAWGLWISDNNVSLHLSSSELGFAGAKALADYALSEKLIWLDVSKANITDEGCVSILRKISRIETLDDGTKTHVLLCKNLKKIVLRHNDLTIQVTDLIMNLFPSYGLCSAASGNCLGQKYLVSVLTPFLQMVASKLNVPCRSSETVLSYSRYASNPLYIDKHSSRVRAPGMGDSIGSFFISVGTTPKNPQTQIVVCWPGLGFDSHFAKLVGPRFVDGGYPNIRIVSLQDNEISEASAVAAMQFFRKSKLFCVQLQGNRISEDHKSVLQKMWISAGKEEVDPGLITGLFL